MKPRADFVCLSQQCEKKGLPSVYELPVLSKVCPVCGKKRLRQLPAIRVNKGTKPDHFDGRHTSSSHAVRTDALVEGPVSAALSQKEKLAIAARRYPMVKAVPIRQLPQALGAVYGGQAPIQVSPGDFGKGQRSSGSLGGVVDMVSGNAVPIAIEARDTEYRVRRTKKADGTIDVQPEKAT